MIMKTSLIVLAALCATTLGVRAHADILPPPCSFALESVPAHPSSSERIGLRLRGGLFIGAGPGVAQATMQSNTIYLAVVLTRDRDAFPGYHRIGDMLQDAFAYVGPLAPGGYPVVITTSSFVDGVTNVPCPAVSQTLTVYASSGPTTTQDAVEFYNAGRDRYFLTADAGEIAFLDQGGEPGWSRTGRGFKVYAVGQSDGRAYGVIRYVSTPASKLDSHVFTNSVREQIVLDRTPEWERESLPFELALPDTLTGECPDRTTPVYRLFNPGNGDHRFTTDGALAAGLRSAGWTQEGYGDVPVAMCAPLT